MMVEGNPQRLREDSEEVSRSPSPRPAEVQHVPFPEEASTIALSAKIELWFVTYLARLKGEGSVAPSICPVKSWDPVVTMLLSGATLFILVAVQHWAFYQRGVALLSIITAFGATSGMVFGATQVHASQPRAVVFGFHIGGVFGVTANHAFGHAPNQEIASGIGAALAVSLSLVVMKITSFIHPPSCSAAIFSAMLMPLNQEFQDEGYMFLVTPLLLGSVTIVFCGWVGNNIFPSRKHYPSSW